MRICKVISQLTISFFCCAGSLFNLLWAEEHNDSVQMNLVYFAPSVYIPEKTLPCQGMRLTGNYILTSPSCYIRILGLLDQTVAIEVMNVEGENIGHLKSTNTAGVSAYYLTMEPDSNNISDSSVTFSTANITNNAELAVYYLDLNNENPVITEQSLNFKSGSGDSPFIQLLPDNYLPDGVAVKFKGKLFCIVSGDLCLRQESFSRIDQLDSNDESSDEKLNYIPCPGANISYHFECEDRQFTECEQGSSPEGGIFILVSGTCTNPESKARCLFHDAWVRRTSPWFCGGYGDINCSSCYANFSYHSYGFYPNCGTTEHPNMEIDCKPRGCIPGCNSKPASDSNSNHLIASIAGGISGGLVLIGSAAAIIVTGCLIYKYRRKAGYQSM